MGGSRAHAPRVGSWALRGFVVLLCVNALIAIAAVLGAAGEDEWRVVGTTLLLTAVCLIVAGNAAAIERHAVPGVPYVAASTATLAIAGLIVAIWAEDVTDHDGFWKTILSLLVVGLAGTYASVLALPTLRRPWEIARRSGWVCAGLLAAITIVAIVAEEGPSGEIYAVLSIVLATSTIVVLIGGAVARRATGDGGRPRPVSGDSPLYCPRCRSHVADRFVAGEHRCAACAQRFTVTPSG